MNQNSSYGRGLLNLISSRVPAFGNVFVVMDPDDYDEGNYQKVQEVMINDSNGLIRFYTSLESAYAACESNNNDVILLDANSSHVLVNGIAWSKNRIHIMGMDGGGRLVQQGAKVQCTSGTGDAYVIKVTGVRNSFRDVKFIQNDVTNTSLHVLEEGGEGNLYERCSFTFGVADNLDLTTATEVLCGSDSATFRECLFGTETLLTSAARVVFTIDQVTASQEFKSNMLDRCTFIISSSNSSALLLKVAAATDVLYSNLFRDCVFLASLDSAGGVALTNAASSVSGLVKGCLAFANPHTFNCTNFMTTSDHVEVSAPASSNNAHEAQVPA